jgi:hypothetical protein
MNTRVGRPAQSRNLSVDRSLKAGFDRDIIQLAAF